MPDRHRRPGRPRGRHHRGRPAPRGVGRRGLRGNSVAFQLAVTDGQLPANDDDPALDPYRAVLRRLDDACRRDTSEIADIAVRASAEVAEAGSSTARLAVLQAMDEAAPTDSGSVDCDSLADAVVADLEAGLPDRFVACARPSRSPRVRLSW